MKIGIAADHGGFELKNQMADYLREAGHEVIDFGAESYDANDDFPDFVIPLSRAVGREEVERGLAICGSGVGASIAANKVRNVRAALITETYSAHQGVEHDNLNMICLGGRVIGIELAKAIIDAFVGADYEGKERQLRRMGKVAELEKDWES
ncbi:RpiB/LacA/LacB family sugar-phosphate isomerase [Flavilitoribacter nigricans]|uniref:Ribose-5-phosphate isomerase n=1 Tax=Flavilitoribacter nigricans (strain ATCC 23147 / DSM 23189 / NBRC 102662 / NCIMB 1420 / SS-2) TaxID=1122177 RepID=A0A2D0NAE6_FLAN2|nr:RpiB/LacA/LacB family sugar-phosphate isomerase [Flavilitoribacter nigricans]PHN05491.1 ribose-5-phosphate isomerase [Flavilitoribacter nigricans DSM 23189 = NBRC 102662]